MQAAAKHEARSESLAALVAEAREGPNAGVRTQRRGACGCAAHVGATDEGRTTRGLSRLSIIQTTCCECKAKAHLAVHLVVLAIHLEHGDCGCFLQRRLGGRGRCVPLLPPRDAHLMWRRNAVRWSSRNTFEPRAVGKLSVVPDRPLPVPDPSSLQSSPGIPRSLWRRAWETILTNLPLAGADTGRVPYKPGRRLRYQQLGPI